MAAIELKNTPLFNYSSLKCYLQFENSLNDTTVNANNFTNSGSTDTASGLFNHGRNFVSTSSQYIFSSSAIFQYTGSQTWMIAFNGTVDNNSCLMGLRSAAGGNAIVMVLDSIIANTLRFEIDTLTGSPQVNSSNLVNGGGWQMCCGRYDATNNKLAVFLNGTKTEISVSGTMTTVGTNFAIGRMGDYNNFYVNGNVDEFAFFQAALSDSDIINYQLGTWSIPNKEVNINQAVHRASRW